MAPVVKGRRSAAEEVEPGAGLRPLVRKRRAKALDFINAAGSSEVRCFREGEQTRHFSVVHFRYGIAGFLRLKEMRAPLRHVLFEWRGPLGLGAAYLAVVVGDVHLHRWNPRFSCNAADMLLRIWPVSRDPEGCVALHRRDRISSDRAPLSADQR